MNLIVQNVILFFMKNNSPQEAIISFLKEIFSGVEVNLSDITHPPLPSFGDYAYSCFSLAKALGRSPAEIANECVNKTRPSEIIRVEARGPYLNFFIDRAFRARYLLEDHLLIKPVASRNEKIMLEYSGPNPCKTFHVGHFRNTILGSSLIRLYRYNGYDVIPINYLNDTGTHVAKVIWLYLRSYKGKEPAINRGAWLGELYVEANQILEADPILMEEVYRVHRNLELGESVELELLGSFKEWSLEDFNRIYKQLDADFSLYFYDSDYIKSGKSVIDDLMKKGIARISEGAVIVDLEEYGLHTALILKSDGTALYITKDLAMAMDRLNHYDVDRLVYVVGAEQILHFKQLFKILELSGFDRARDCYHLAYELVNARSGKKMATRAGTVVLYDDLINQAMKIAYKETKDRHSDWEDTRVKETAEVIALAALKFDMLKQDPQKRVNFDIEKALDVSGDTGPYILYTIARLRSILNRVDSGMDVVTPDFSKLPSDEELLLLNDLEYFSKVLIEAADQHKPSLIAHAVLNCARHANQFYHKYQILSDDQHDRRSARLLLIRRVINLAEEALGFLVIRTLREM